MGLATGKGRGTGKGGCCLWQARGGQHLAAHPFPHLLLLLVLLLLLLLLLPFQVVLQRSVGRSLWILRRE